MIYQHWIGTLSRDPDADEEAARCVDLWFPARAPVCASRFEREPWQAAPLAGLIPSGGRFAGTVEYWYGDEEEDDEEE
jgi:hypothetical protein